jgi:hypothetical protein
MSPSGYVVVPTPNGGSCLHVSLQVDPKVRGCAVLLWPHPTVEAKCDDFMTAHGRMAAHVCSHGFFCNEATIYVADTGPDW